MSKTFADLGIPFQLFEAPVEEVAGYCGINQCALCDNANRYCFELDIDDQLVIECENCGAESALDADDRLDVACLKCGATVVFPNHIAEQVIVCYECLRGGKAALGKDTVVGMVGWEQANAGITHGVPHIENLDFEIITIETEYPDSNPPAKTMTQDGAAGWVAVEQSDDWYAARIPKELLFELVRTPSYPTWQGEQWQFCCGKPMIYVGSWNQTDFEQHAGDGDGRALFLEIVDSAHDELWENGQMATAIVTYMFRCPICSRYKGHWDVN